MNDNRLLNMLTIRIYISLMITIFTSIYDKVITSSPVRVVRILGSCKKITSFIGSRVKTEFPTIQRSIQ
ncbi:unnamed protein product [Heterobilharzia americana]|nr:unnamed protein product [Heterobilharzia americana]